MEVIAQFRKLLLAQVILGIIAFCFAGSNAGLMVVAGGLVVLSWYIVEGPTGHPLPQWLIVAGAGVAAAWLVIDLPSSRGSFVLGIGYFTMALQILLLFSRKSNREYGEILILSLMQIVGASVLDQSIMYGLLLTVYCGLAIFTLLVFQLKVTSDWVAERAHQATPNAAGGGAVVGRGHRWQFRATAAVLGVGCALIGTVVFILAPRNEFQRLHTSPMENSGTRQVGYTSTVNLTTTPDDATDTEPVLHLTLSIRDTHLDGPRTLHLRGTALDVYDPATGNWVRSTRAQAFDNWKTGIHEGRSLVTPPPGTTIVDAHVVLRTPLDNTLFTLYPPLWIKSGQLDEVQYSTFDQRISGRTSTGGPLEYDFRSPATSAGLGLVEAMRPPGGPPGYEVVRSAYMRNWKVDPKRVRVLALGVIHAAHLDRDPGKAFDPHDHQIAVALADYLRKNYRYTISRKPTPPDHDPITDFLFDDKAGHCELFAAGLTAMARSIGVTSRVVSGFLVSEYNEVGGYYVARQSNAHAWTEVYCPGEGWVEFDATPVGGRSYHLPPAPRFAAFRQMYDYLDFAWLSAVVTYDQQTRLVVLNTISQWSATFFDYLSGGFRRGAELTRAVAHSSGLEQLHIGVLVVAAVAALLAGGSLVQLLLTRRRHREALQLHRLPRGQRPAMARHLTFYLDAVELLERHGLVRPPWQSPMAFAEGLVRAHAQRLAPLTDLTSIFYEIRFGGRQLDPSMQARIRDKMGLLHEGLKRFSPRSK